MKLRKSPDSISCSGFNAETPEITFLRTAPDINTKRNTTSTFRNTKLLAKWASTRFPTSSTRPITSPQRNPTNIPVNGRHHGQPSCWMVLLQHPSGFILKHFWPPAWGKGYDSKIWQTNQLGHKCHNTFGIDILAFSFITVAWKLVKSEQMKYVHNKSKHILQIIPYNTSLYMYFLCTLYTWYIQYTILTWPL